QLGTSTCQGHFRKSRNDREAAGTASGDLPWPLGGGGPSGFVHAGLGIGTLLRLADALLDLALDLLRLALDLLARVAARAAHRAPHAAFQLLGRALEPVLGAL